MDLFCSITLMLGRITEINLAPSTCLVKSETPMLLELLNPVVYKSKTPRGLLMLSLQCIRELMITSKDQKKTKKLMLM